MARCTVLPYFELEQGCSQEQPGFLLADGLANLQQVKNENSDLKQQIMYDLFQKRFRIRGLVLWNIHRYMNLWLIR